ncbi:MAG: VanZ family protein [Oscillospiraceae bacterium]|jgi:glycopeptide antibiotics resistance protein|nr:VanZ family protein [Oscillospiraceae bacterium]
MLITDIIPLGAVAIVAAAILTVIACIRQKRTLTQAIYVFAVRFFGLWYALIAVTLLFKLFTVRFAVSGEENPLRANFVPFRTIMQYVKQRNTVQIFGNIAALFPLPIMLHLNFPRTPFRKCAVIAAVVTILIEPLQLLVNIAIRAPFNVVDIDDLILNAVGVAVGLLAVRFVMIIRVRVRERE